MRSHLAAHIKQSFCALTKRLYLCVMLASGLSTAYAQNILSGFYSGHMNTKHDAGSDMKKMGLQMGLSDAEGNQLQFSLFGAALTPPNGMHHTLPGRKVHGYPSNQKDTYLMGMSIAKQWHDRHQHTFQLHGRLGVINGRAENIMRTAVDHTHRMANMKNLRHSPASSKEKPLLELAAVNNHRLFSVGNALHMNGTESLVLGNLSRKVILGMNLQLASHQSHAISGDISYLPWTETTSQLYIGLYRAWHQYDLVTDYAGTEKAYSFIVVGAQLSGQSWGMSVAMTHYLNNLVRQQSVKTDRYLQLQMHYHF